MIQLIPNLSLSLPPKIAPMRALSRNLYVFFHYCYYTNLLVFFASTSQHSDENSNLFYWPVGIPFRFLLFPFFLLLRINCPFRFFFSYILRMSGWGLILNWFPLFPIRGRSKEWHRFQCKSSARASSGNSILRLICWRFFLMKSFVFDRKKGFHPIGSSTSEILIWKI